ncbi:MAG: aminotransferase class V-fold PLP-dependent enzyme [Bacteroidales bacterium]
MMITNTYFDNASTSFPKPKAVAESICEYLTNCGGTYGRAAYKRVFQATSLVEKCRDSIAEISGWGEPDTIFFTQNATVGCNSLICSFPFKEGDTVFVSPLEHNAVMRPLHNASIKHGLNIRILPHFSDGKIDTSRLDEDLKQGASLIIVNHQSNVNGVIQPMMEIGKWCGETIEFWADLSQSLGQTECLLDKWGVDAAFFTGHKSLLGPTGVGGFMSRHASTRNPFIYGGTGSNSESFDMPEILPDRYEAGTPNMVGIISLLAAIENKPTPAHNKEDFFDLLEGVKKNNKLRVICANESCSQGELFSITHSSLSPSEISTILYNRWGIETRQGLHCSPLAHKHLKTFPTGCTRFSLSPYHTREDIKCLQRILSEL